MILFNFVNQDFEFKMGGKIAQLIFENTKAPEFVELNNSDVTENGNEGYGGSRL